MLSLIARGVVLGLGATMLIDLWAQLLALFPGQRRPDWAPVGRWFWHLGQGRLVHASIAAAPTYRHELALGWAGHYAVGIVYGAVFALIAGEGWMAAPRLLPALVFGLVTIAAGWFLLHPGMGLGWAASRSPNPTRARVLGLVSHAIFGLGLYATALLI